MDPAYFGTSDVTTEPRGSCIPDANDESAFDALLQRQTSTSLCALDPAVVAYKVASGVPETANTTLRSLTDENHVMTALQSLSVSGFLGQMQEKSAEPVAKKNKPRNNNNNSNNKKYEDLRSKLETMRWELQKIKDIQDRFEIILKQHVETPAAAAPAPTPVAPPVYNNNADPFAYRPLIDHENARQYEKSQMWKAKIDYNANKTQRWEGRQQGYGGGGRGRPWKTQGYNNNNRGYNQFQQSGGIEPYQPGGNAPLPRRSCPQWGDTVSGET